MNRTKIAPHDLTLLDEFEKDAKEVIRILEEAKTDPRFTAQTTINDVIRIAESFRSFGDISPQLCRFLRHHIPSFELKVKNGFSKINDKIKEISTKCAQHSANPTVLKGVMYVEMGKLNQDIENLRKALSFCVRTAREQQNSQEKDGQPAETKPDIAPNKWRKAWSCIKKVLKIFGAIIAFLAALLTIFYYLGLLDQFNAIIEKMLSAE